MLGYVISDGEGAADGLFQSVACRLAAGGHVVAGAVQRSGPRSGAPGAGAAPEMVLEVIAGGARRQIRISQDLGALSQGCRLDPGALEEAVGLVEAALSAVPAPALLIVNRFGRQEAEGRGFRATIGRALAMGIPVLTAVKPGFRPAFEAFAGGLAEPLPDEAEGTLGWCLARIG